MKLGSRLSKLEASQAELTAAVRRCGAREVLWFIDTFGREALTKLEGTAWAVTDVDDLLACLKDADETPAQRARDYALLGQDSQRRGIGEREETDQLERFIDFLLEVGLIADRDELEIVKREL